MMGTILIWIIDIYAILTDKISGLIPDNFTNFIDTLGTTPIKVMNAFGNIMPQIMHAVKTMIGVSFILFGGVILINLFIKVATMFVPSNVIRTNE